LRKVEILSVFTRALRNISRRKLRVLMVVIALGFSMAILVSIPAGIQANQTAAEQLSLNYSSTLANTEAAINQTATLIDVSNSSFSGPGPQFGGGQGFSGRGTFYGARQNYMNESAFYDIRNITGVTVVVPILDKSEGNVTARQTRYGTFNVFVAEYIVVGVPLNSSLIGNYAVLPSNNSIIAGRNLREGDSGDVLLSLNNTAYFGFSSPSAAVNRTVSIQGSSFTVIGVYQTSDVTQQRNLYISLSEAQAITGLEGKISTLNVYAANQTVVSPVASQITALFPELAVSTYTTRLAALTSQESAYQTAITNAEASLSNTQTVAYEEVGIAVVATSLIVLFVMLYTVRERTHEIGVLKAIGFSNWNVMNQFIVEGVMMSLMAGAVGVVIGTVAAPILSSLLLPRVTSISGAAGGAAFRGFSLTSTVTATVNPQLILLAFGVAVLLGALGSLYPAWRASRTSPMEALKYE
jgi:putative ABC transport system permease protein